MSDTDFSGNSIINNTLPDGVLSGSNAIVVSDPDQDVSGNENLTNAVINYITQSTSVDNTVTINYGGTNVYGGTSISGGTNIYGGTSIVGGTAGGTSGDIQFNTTAGTFGGSPSLKWDAALNRLVLVGPGNNNYIGADYYEVNVPYNASGRARLVGNGIEVDSSGNNGVTTNTIRVGWTTIGSDVVFALPQLTGTSYQGFSQYGDGNTYWSDNTKHQIGINVTSASALTTGTKGFGPINYNFKVQEASILLDTVGTARFDVLKGPLSGYPIGTSITSGVGIPIASPNTYIKSELASNILNTEFVIYKLMDVDTTIRTIVFTLHGVKI